MQELRAAAAGAATPRQSKKLSPEIRKQIEQRDRVCVYCKDPYGPYEIDHIVPRVRGGTDNPRNLALACVRCNHVKGYKNVTNFLRLMDDIRAGRKRITKTNITGIKVKP
jgi:5-methylcytosine-specific restriction endonuclease McrA